MTDSEIDEFVEHAVKAATEAFRRGLDPDRDWHKYLPYSGEDSIGAELQPWNDLWGGKST